MAAPQSVTWPIDRHTKAKHEIFRRYLEVWLPILITRFKQARIIDGFAGPGEYEGGDIGSPLIALDVLLTHSSEAVRNAVRQGKIELIFIEQDRRRSENLQRLLASQRQELACPPGLKTTIITGTFVQEIQKILTVMEKQQAMNNPIPSFVFIDPFGYSHTPLNIITRILHLPMCEVLITFMFEEINRFLKVSYSTKDVHYDELFGTNEWRQITKDASSPLERMNEQQNLYRRQLLTKGGAKYVRSFRMRNQHNATDYFLFFATNSAKGLLEMKRAMWKVDPTGAFEFSDFSNPYQPLLLNEPNYVDLQRQLSEEFRGKTVRIEDVEEYVLAETPYLAYKRDALVPMEAASPPKIRVLPNYSGPKRRKGTFPEGQTFIEFL
jgi:three-Cys-motif partner protein